MLYINDIFKASVCSFCENIYEDNSLDENEFVKYLKDFFQEEDLEECLKYCTSEVIYDTKNIDNACNNILLPKYKLFKEMDVIEPCKRAYLKTLKEDKTINVEAFVDNLTQKFLEHNK